MNFKYIYLFFILLHLNSPSFSQDINFTEHIAPIILKNCAPCHHSKGIAPFPLTNYSEVAAKAKMIKHVTQIRYMPPWKADPHYVSYANERILKPEEIDLIKKWVDAKTPRGKKEKINQSLLLSAGTQEVTPDLILKMSKPYLVKGNNDENFVMFKIPFELPEEKNIEAVEFVIGNRKIVHHTNYAIYEAKEDADIYGGDEFIASNTFLNDFTKYAVLLKKLFYYGGWIPGTSAQKFGGDMGFVLPKKGVILLNMHYGATPIDEIDQSAIHFFYKSKPVKRIVETMSIGSGGVGNIIPDLIIPPDTVMNFKARWVTDVDISLLFVWPHMHLLGKDFQAYAVYLNDTIPLVKIPAWDFNWQEAYQFKKMVKIPANSFIIVEATYDNTSNNPRNPYNPPRTIVSDGLMESKNEMLNLILIYLPYQEGDENIFTK